MNADLTQQQSRQPQRGQSLANNGFLTAHKEEVMLVLTRKPNEEIVIGGSIRVKVLEISGNRVRLGISAPGQVPVMREEVYARIAQGQDSEMTLVLSGAGG